MATLQNFDVISGKFNIVGLFSSGYYAQNWVMKFCSNCNL